MNAPRCTRSQVSFPSDADTIDTNSSSIDDPDLNEEDTPVLLVEWYPWQFLNYKHHDFEGGHHIVLLPASCEIVQ